MSFYVDLGVREGASREEIRAAYLLLAKVLHPDKVQGEHEQLLAKDRMTRVNQAMAILGNEEKRADYDSELRRQRASADARVHEALAMQAFEAARRGAAWSPRNGKRMAWMAGAVVVLGTLAVIAFVATGPDDGAGSPTRRTPSGSARIQKLVDTVGPAPAGRSQSQSAVPAVSDAAGPSHSPQPSEVTQGKSPTRDGMPASLRETPDRRIEQLALQASRAALLAEATRALEAPVPQPIIHPPPAAASAPASARVRNDPPPPRTPVVVAEVPPVVKVSVSRPEPTPSWKGIWRYSADKVNGGSSSNGQFGQFKALTIEMRLQDVDGRIHGIYKAKYGASEPNRNAGDVDLLLSAMSSAGDWMRGVWSGNGGAYGQFELNRIGDGRVEMNWWTTKVGPHHALASGSAQLVENRQ